MSEQKEKSPNVHCDMYGGVYFFAERERDDFILAQLVIAAICVLVTLAYLLIL
ncbi:hypothetical protein [Mesorhizobium sp. ORS 3428]|uniref:Uncharacterized protein n=1 Tax=Mesorhizobium plurifarium TaxID=69974 RepID=A0A090F190_MESPL|nr:hypothetical protein [Mesorhizobium sp. ORS 3428]CDX33082.1 hypothetical protein MPLSOD_150055 [Mesorhizobium sp. SOD10]CDX35389.1 hypothetical protein MPLDJ20_20172 [Mesorhizobium plurifarium]